MEGREERKGVPLPPEVVEPMQRQLEAFRLKFGRDPGPHDPIFFDPDKDEPTAVQEADWNAAFAEAATKVGMDPALIFAVQRTGMFVTEMNLDAWSEEDLEEFDAAIEEYRALERQETSPVAAARGAEDEDVRDFASLLEQTPAEEALTLAQFEERYGSEAVFWCPLFLCAGVVKTIGAGNGDIILRLRAIGSE